MFVKISGEYFNTDRIRSFGPRYGYASTVPDLTHTTIVFDLEHKRTLNIPVEGFAKLCGCK